MKKTFLFLAAGVIAATAQGQQASPSVVFNQSQAPVKHSNSMKAGFTGTAASKNEGSIDRLTSACTTCGRWYDYVDSVVGINASLVNALSFTGFDIWQDTTGIFGYTGTPDYANTDFTSVGLLFHPWASAWNSALSFSTGEMAISSANAYTIDSIVIGGSYNRNAAKPSIVDTLVVQFVYGDGTGTSNLPLGIQFGPNASNAGLVSLLADYDLAATDSIPFVSMLFDSTNNPADNRAGGSGGAITYPYPVATELTSPGVLKFLLTALDTNTSTSIATLSTVYPRVGHVPADPTISIGVPAGDLSGVSVSFKSGDPALHHAFPADTVRYTSGTAITGYKYGAWSPLVAYESDGGTGEGFPPYPNAVPGTDWTVGYFNEEGQGPDQAYEPNWAWTTSTGASVLQYPYIMFHAKCPTCNTVGTASLSAATVTPTNMIKVYPNPANDQVNIAYTLVNSAAVTATLTNTLGQVVATQKAPNGTSGNITFNTNTLAEGVYLYTVEANGNRTTGRIVVAH